MQLITTAENTVRVLISGDELLDNYVVRRARKQRAQRKVEWVVMIAVVAVVLYIGW